MIKTIAVALLTSFVAGCSADIEKLRELQDERIKTDGLPVVLAEFRAKYESSPNDPKVAYLYGRLTEGDDLRVVADKLLKDAPDFAWSHYLARVDLRERGLYEESLAELKKAVALDPNSKLMKSVLAEESQLAVVTSETLLSVVTRLSAARTTRADQSESESDWLNHREAELYGTNMDAIARWFTAPPVKFGNVDLLAMHFGGAYAGKDLLVRLLVHNRGGSSIQLNGDDVERDRVGACFTASGKKVGPTPKLSMEKDPTQCRAHPLIDLSIAPGTMGRPHAYFPRATEALDRCVFFDMPTRGSTVLIKFLK